MRLGVAAAVVGADLLPGDVEVTDGLISAIGLAPAGGSRVALPGFVDVHVHGHGGTDFVTASVDDHLRVSQQITSTGVTAYNPTLMSLPIADLAAAMREHATGQGTGAKILGFHLEGPFLSPSKPGAHRPDALVSPNRESVDRLLDAGPVDHITIAPEVDGALEAIELLATAGVVVSLGHSTANEALTHTAVDAGATAFTHIFNAMPPLQHRDPGMVGVALTRPDVFITGIFDGVHLSDAVARIVLTAVGDRVVAITDGTSAVNSPSEKVYLGDREVHIVDGAPRLADGTLAGSILTMDGALRNLVGLGLDLPSAAHATSTAPARLAKLAGIGEVRIGAVADITVVNDRLEVVRTIVDGVDVFRP